MSVLLIDNYDSFVHNLARYLRELGANTHVVRNDELSLDEIEQMAPQAIILSPGPCTPNEAGLCIPVVQRFCQSIPILGVCLGHQAIGAAFGAAIVRSPLPVHGWTSDIEHDGTGLFEECPQPLRVTRYHSLLVDRTTVPDDLCVTAWTSEGLVMGLAHRKAPVFGVQFHPESILSTAGHRLLANFLTISGMPITESLPPGDLPRAANTGDDFFEREIDLSGVPPRPHS